MTKPPLINSHRIGASTALLSPVTGAIVLTNEFGRRIHEGLQAGLNTDQIAGQIADTPQDRKDALQAVRTVLSSWEQAGLLQQDTPDFPDPVTFAPVEGNPLRFGGTKGAGQVTVPHETLAEQLETILGHMRALPGQPTTNLTSQPSAGGFAIFKERVALSGRISLDAARFVIVREMAEIVCGSADVAAVFHAGCVSQNGQALMICGDSGQGKSTLTFGLVAAGCDYLGDDHIPLHCDGRSALSFPTAAGVKPGSWGLPEISALQTQYGLTPLSPRQGVRYIPLHQASAPAVGEKRAIAAVVFPHFHPEAEFEMTRLSPEQALIQALKAGSRLSQSHKSNLAPLCNFLNDVPAYTLQYSSSDQSVPACLNLLSSPKT
ncbi:MAG: hypothetical protein ACRBBS_08580 [Thalassovita sp.]